MAKRTHKQKLGRIELTDEQKMLVAANADTEFFKLITDVIIPQRINQIALTTLYGARDTEDLRFYQGMAHLGNWSRDFLLGEAQKVDTTDYTDDDDAGVSDDDPDD